MQPHASQVSHDFPYTSQPLRSWDKHLKDTQHLSHSFLHRTEIVASQQLVQAWEMIIAEHICRNARRMKEGTRLRIKPKGSAPTWNEVPKGKWHSGRLLAKEIAVKESPEDTDTDNSVIVDDDTTMSENWITLPPSDRNSCWSSIEKPMDIS